MKMFVLFISLSLLGSSSSFANIFDEDEAQNSLDQLSLNQVSSELSDLEKNQNLTQLYLPPTQEINKEEDTVETKLAAPERTPTPEAEPSPKKEEKTLRVRSR